MAVKPVPEGYHTVTPYLAVDDAAAAIDYYKKAFGATERVRMDTPDGRIGHAELEIGDSLVMLADTFPDMGGKSPKTIGGSPPWPGGNSKPRHSRALRSATQSGRSSI